MLLTDRDSGKEFIITPNHIPWIVTVGETRDIITAASPYHADMLAEEIKPLEVGETRKVFSVGDHKNMLFRRKRIK